MGDETYYVYLVCPECQDRIKEPLSRFSGPIAFLHHGRRKRACRLIVEPDPKGENHIVRQVPPGQSLEEALVLALTRRLHDQGETPAPGL